LVAASVLAEGVPRPVTLYPPAARSVPRVALDRVLDVRVEATPSRVTVPVALGRVISRSAVGSAALRVVSNPSTVVPSNITPNPRISGEVNFLFVRVCESVSPTTLPVTPWTPAVVGVPEEPMWAENSLKSRPEMM
jgi:hypothetical protein